MIESQETHSYGSARVSLPTMLAGAGACLVTAAIISAATAFIATSLTADRSTKPYVNAACARAVTGLNLWLSHGQNEFDAAKSLGAMKSDNDPQVAAIKSVVQTYFSQSSQTDGAFAEVLRGQVGADCPGVSLPTSPAFLGKSP